MRAIGVIPARYASSRLPGKPLVDLCGQTMIERVYRRAAAARRLAEVWVATDDERIAAVVRGFGGRVAMTRADHPSGTDRIAEVAAALEADVVVNVQGDEPLLDPESIDAIVEPFHTEREMRMTTLAAPIGDAVEIEDTSIVKVVCDAAGDALYFSRYPIPFYRSGKPGVRLKHLGLYGYSRDFLLEYAAMPPAELELAECLEQLRALVAGVRIRVVVRQHSGFGIDTPEDVARARQILATGELPHVR